MAMILLPVPVVAMAHELIKDSDARLFASLSLLGLALTLFWIGLFDDPSYFDQIFLPMSCLGFFVGTFFAPLAVITLHGLPRRVMSHAGDERCFFVGELPLSRIVGVCVARPSHPCRPQTARTICACLSR
jgi:hypothetical protein